MNRAQAKVRYEGTEHEQWIDKYQEADEHQWLNVDDIDLHPIRTKLPECPPWHLITNFGQEPEDQVFVRDNIPFKIEYISKKIRTDVRKDKKLDTMSSKYRAFYNRVWEALETDRNYGDATEWLAEQWYYRLNGKWYFIKGKPTYICGWHWFYLNYWNIENFGLPEYRDRDRKWFWAMWYFYTDTTIPVKKDGKLLYNDDGSLQLEDVGYRTVEGINGLKGRRMGDTTKTACVNFCVVSSMKEGKGGIQGDSGETGQKAFLEKLMFSYNKLQFFWKPAQLQINPKNELMFDSDDPELGLQSLMDYASTAGKSHYDGRKLHFYHGDEAGKCLGIHEKIRMSNGDVRELQDVNIGDYVMGIDGTPREVLNKLIGEDDMYKIIPTKGREWTCNSKHTMTVKWARSDRTFRGKKKGEMIDIGLQDYLSSTKSQQKHMMLFKGHAKFKTNKHDVDPYLLGLYLGDGATHSGAIANIDKEIIDYLRDYCNTYGYELTRNHISYRISTGKGRKVDVFDASTNEKIKSYDNLNDARDGEGIGKIKILRLAEQKLAHNGKIYASEEIKISFKEMLRAIDVLNNKHIPKSYMQDSESNRLQLLAGLLDTDGSLNKKKGKPSSYEITQVRKDLAYQIHELTQGLGLSSIINYKATSMKRDDGSYYKGEAYRVMIYGDLYRIPCKIERKIAEKSDFHINRRNPMHRGFKVKPIGEGTYCGIQISGDGLFMLDDYTVVHNCVLENIHDRHSVVRRCMKVGSKIIGFYAYTTTVDDMSLKSGIEFEKLSKNSHYHQRSGSGLTQAGMVNLFFPAYDGFEGFIGKYGESIMDTPTEDQLSFIATPKRNEDGEWMGAREFLQTERDALTESGDFVELAHQKRLYPFTFAECFTPPAQNIFFNMDLLEQNHIALKRDNEAAIQGDYVWMDGRDSWVDFIPSATGKWFVSKILPKGESNKRFSSNGVRFPGNALKYVSSSDAFRLEKTQGSRMSDGGGVVRWKRDAQIDGDDKDIRDWQSARPVSVYRFRPPSIEEYCEDMLIQDVYWGSMQYPENNVNHVADHYRKRGYEGYLLHDTDPQRGTLKANAGFHSGGALKQRLFNLVGQDIIKNGLRNRHIQITEECMKIKGLDDMTNYDLFTAHAGTLLAEESQHAQFLQQLEHGDSYEIEDFF